MLSWATLLLKENVGVFLDPVLSLEAQVAVVALAQLWQAYQL